MDKEKVLNEIFNDDPFELLIVKQKRTSKRTDEERLLESFRELNEFVTNQNREPEPNLNDIQEYKLYSRLKGFRESNDKIHALESEDKHGLLKFKEKEINSIDDILDDDHLNILGEDIEGLFVYKHIPKVNERASTDFVARRKPCKDFEKYEEIFKDVQKDLVTGKRKLIPFKQKDLRTGDFYVHSGILLFLEAADIKNEKQKFGSGKRIRKDGRTRIIFENGTESNMLYRSLYKALLDNGKAVTQNIKKVNEDFAEYFSKVTKEDEETGYIYVLKSRSNNKKVALIKNLYKIGYSKIEVQERIKNAEKEPTFLMSPVDYVVGWKCFNMNPQKFEKIIHKFFGSSCLELDVFDEKGKRHTPREWFITPFEVIEQAIELIINGKVVDYKYDPENETIIRR